MRATQGVARRRITTGRRLKHRGDDKAHRRLCNELAASMFLVVLRLDEIVIVEL